MRRTFVLVALSLIGATVAIPAGAQPATTPDQWWSLSLNAAETASTVHITARGFTYATANGFTNSLDLDLHVVANKGAVGWVGTPYGPIGLMRLGPSLYLRMSAAKWRKFGMSPKDSKTFANRWIKGPAGNDVNWLISITDVTQLFDDIFETHTALVGKGARTIGGQPAVGVLENKRFTLWIATTGKPYPLAAYNARHFGVLRFSSWNAPVHLVVPKNPIDLTK